MQAACIAHNESKYIGKAVSSIFKFIKPDRLVLVADGCTDNTADIARDLGAEVYEEKNLKIGTSMCSALDRLKDEIVFFSPGDVELIADPSPLLDLMEPDVFVVTGRMKHPSGRVTRRQPWGVNFCLSYLRRKVILDTPGFWEQKSNIERVVCRWAFNQGWKVGFDESRVYGIHYADARSLIGAMRFAEMRRLAKQAGSDLR